MFEDPVLNMFEDPVTTAFGDMSCEFFVSFNRTIISSIACITGKNGVMSFRLSLIGARQSGQIGVMFKACRRCGRDIIPPQHGNPIGSSKRTSVMGHVRIFLICFQNFGSFSCLTSSLDSSRLCRVTECEIFDENKLCRVAECEIFDENKLCRVAECS
jgi:hypothetical protein